MAVYINVTCTARIKIQDPYDTDDIEKAIEDTHLHCPHELVDEDYNFKIEDAD